MLKTRIITALILGALVISAVFHPSHIFFSLLVSAFVLFGAWEWSVLAGLKLPFLRLIYAMSVLLATLGLTSLEGLFPITLLLLPVNIFWVFTFLWLIFGPSPEVQKILDECSGAYWSKHSGEVMDDANMAAFKEMLEYDKKVGNPETYSMPQEEFQRWEEAVKPVSEAWIAETEAKGLPAKSVYEDVLRLIEKYSK